MFKFDWIALLRGIQKAVNDARANKPLPVAAQTQLSSDQLLRTVNTIEDLCQALRSEIAKHPGEVLALEDLAGTLVKLEVPYAPDLQVIIKSAPNVINEAITLLPKLSFILEETQPAPTGIPGGWSGARGHIL